MTERPPTARADRTPDTGIDPSRPATSSDVEDPGAPVLLGLSTSEQRLYEVLLTCPPVAPSDVDDLATELGWSSSETQAVLDRLCALGLVTRLATTPPRHTVIPPYNALHARLDTHSRGLTRAHRRMLDLSTRFHARHSHRDDDPGDTGSDHAGQPGGVDGPPLRYSVDPLVTVVRGQEEITRALEEANRIIEHQVLGFDSPPYFGDPTMGNVVGRDEPPRDMDFRVVFDPRSLQHSPPLLGLLVTEEWAANSAFRVADVPVKLSLIDGRLGVMVLDETVDPVEALLVIRDPVVLTALRSLFELCWQQAVPVRVHHQATVRELPTGDRELLVMLVSGFSDRDIATRLGWHERSVRRRVADLMRRIGANTRFQAGYRAVADGWLPPDFATPSTLAAVARSTTARSTPDDGAKPDGTPERVGRP